MLEQILESFLGTDHGRNAQQTLQQQGVPPSGIQQILSEALAAHSNGATPQASTGLLGSVFPFVSRFMQEHLGGQQQNAVQHANNPAAQAKFDANVAGKGVMTGTTPEGAKKLDAMRQAEAGGAKPFGKPDAFSPQKQAGDYGNEKQNAGKGFPQK